MDRRLKYVLEIMAEEEKAKTYSSSLPNYSSLQEEEGGESPGQVLEKLVCPLCFDIPHRVQELPCCTYLICSKCTKSWFATHSTCPFCRSTLTHLNQVPGVQATLDALQVFCPYSDNGCDWIGIKANVMDHLLKDCIIAIDPETGVRSSGTFEMSDIFDDDTVITIPPLIESRESSESIQEVEVNESTPLISTPSFYSFWNRQNEVGWSYSDLTQMIAACLCLILFVLCLLFIFDAI